MLNPMSLLTSQSTSLLNPTKNLFCFFPITLQCSVHSPSTSHFATFSFPSSRKSQQHIVLCTSYRQRRIGFRVYALKKRGKIRTGIMEMNDDPGDDDFDDFLDDEEGSDFDEDDDEEGMRMLFGKMKKWSLNKPRGFGEGKVYDTSIEDKLFEEMQQSRIAQAANLDKLENDSNKVGMKKKASEVVSGVRVRVINLPKKKNIRRDLKLAFEGVRGIINITPAVAGNKKTRDPVCKGFAFVDFKFEEDAARFVQTFSGQSLTFGKIQKQIKCEMVDDPSSISAHDHSSDNTNTTTPLLTIPKVEVEHIAHVDMDDSSAELWEESEPEDFDHQNDEIIRSTVEDIRKDLESVGKSNSLGSDGTGSRPESLTESPSIKELEKMGALERIRMLEKRLLSKGQGQKVLTEKVPVKAKKKVPKKNLSTEEKGKKASKIKIPGSAKRLKVKEKAVLNDVFSRYGLKKADSGSKEE